ncbi:MAG: bifunctional adenosylcobinamide kinase/adenosylcobinamide-phosphate guanylyltransferase [Fusobacteriales bacterium]|nr:bifunctional adenosylcobinamide kinase/adenosylcobinamide-phosphate guanylyltransferase [Fusobacteriales bacterium]
MGIIFITGGAKSGKSKFAESLAFKREKRLYLATSVPLDNEMKNRVQKHRKQRGEDWITIEAYKDLDKILEKTAENIDVILLDCLTNMISNIMFEVYGGNWESIPDYIPGKIERIVLAEVNKILDFNKVYMGDIILVSNEVGLGLVPENLLGRYFRDIAGSMNQLIAAESDEVYMVISGIPVKIK